jgi:DNA invertase Pin-like site-specific DNA recombinase
VTEVIRQFMKRGIVVRTVINGLVFDGATKEPMQMAVRDALISFMAALSQAQAEATKEAQRAGIEHAKGRDDAYRGRKPSFTRQQLDQVRDMLTTGTSISTIAKTTGLSRKRSTGSRMTQRGSRASSRGGRPSPSIAGVSTAGRTAGRPRCLKHIEAASNFASVQPFQSTT